MKYAPHTYAKALVEALTASGGSKEKDDALSKNFLALVRKNGDEGRLKKILEEASRFARGKSGVRKITIVSARELTGAQEAEMARFIKAGDVVERRIEPELIAGVKIVINDELQFDGSLKNKLNKVLQW